MTDYFKKCLQVEEIKQVYRELALTHHPDRGGDTPTMQDINGQYHEALAQCDGQKAVGSDGKERTYTYREDLERATIAKIDELLALKLADVNIWLIGYWLWIDGDTYPHREKLKEAGCMWNRKRQMWYWREGKYRGQRSSASFSSLANKYGATKLAREQEGRERAALQGAA